MYIGSYLNTKYPYAQYYVLNHIVLNRWGGALEYNNNKKVFEILTNSFSHCLILNVLSGRFVTSLLIGHFARIRGKEIENAKEGLVQPNTFLIN